MTIPTFTLKGSALDLLDTDDPTPLQSIVLTPNTRGQVISIGATLYRPEPITVELDEDGKLNGDNGIELLANGPDVNLDAPLQWNVQITAESGFPRQPKSFWVDAGLDGETVYLGDISPAPLQAATGISRGPRGVDDVQVVGGSLQFSFRGEPVGGPLPVIPTWTTLTGKPIVIAAGATQADARAAIGAGTGTSNLTLGSTSTTAKPGDYQPASANISDATVTGRAVLTATDAAAARSAISAKPADYTPSLNEVTTALGFTPENAANRNAANGYAGLDSSGLVPAALLPGFVDDVLEAANLAAFPATGAAGKLYVALDTGKVYRWSGSTYIEVSASPGSTDAVPEGSVNQYFTSARAQSALASQLSGKSDVGHTHAWSTLTDKPAVIAAGATQADARAAIGAGTSSLEIGTTAQTAKAGNYAPTSQEIVAALTYTPLDAAARGQANGVAALDATGKVPAAQLPAVSESLNTFLLMGA